MLFRSTVTLSRDTALGLSLTAVMFYDGQGFMVPAKSGIKSAKQLKNATVCTQSGTTTEKNLSDFSRAHKLGIKPVVFEKLDAANAAYFSGRCQAYTTDASGLASTRSAQGANASQHVILPEIISKEPLGPAVRHGDNKWADIVRWTFNVMVEAEEMGLTSGNIDSKMNDSNPGIQRLVGKTGDMGKQLGLENNWSYSIIKQVGNYGETYELNIKPIGQIGRAHV